MSRDEDVVEIVKRVARRRMAKSDKFDRWVRALEEGVPGESTDERKKRLSDLHWQLFGEAPPFDRDAKPPGEQAKLPLGGWKAS